MSATRTRALVLSRVRAGLGVAGKDKAREEAVADRLRTHPRGTIPARARGDREALLDLMTTMLIAQGAEVTRAARAEDAVRTIAVVEPATLARSFSGWIAQLKTNRAMLQLQPASAMDVEAVCGRRVPLRPDQPFPPGRGVLVDRVGATLVQVARPGAGSLGSPPQ